MRWTALLIGMFIATTASATPASLANKTGSEMSSPIRGKVEAMPTLSSKMHRWLKPKHHLLGANPRNNTDFTAYTLEMGEVKVGIAAITVGIAPRTQIATVPLLNALGVYNGSLKVNAVHAGPLDLALSGTYHRLTMGEFVGSYLGAGAMMSLMAWLMPAATSWTRWGCCCRMEMDGLMMTNCDTFTLARSWCACACCCCCCCCCCD